MNEKRTNWSGKAARTEGIERLRTLYSVLVGIPASNIDLQNWQKYGKVSYVAHCGTIGCAMGWATLYPPFQAMGLSAVSGHPLFTDDVGNEHEGWSAVSNFFALKEEEAEELFGSMSRRERFYRIPDKQVALRRIRGFLLSHMVITKQRSYDLEAMEMMELRA